MEDEQVYVYHPPRYRVEPPYKEGRDIIYPKKLARTMRIRRDMVRIAVALVGDIAYPIAEKAAKYIEIAEYRNISMKHISMKHDCIVGILTKVSEHMKNLEIARKLKELECEKAEKCFKDRRRSSKKFNKCYMEMEKIIRQIENISPEQEIINIAHAVQDILEKVRPSTAIMRKYIDEEAVKMIDGSGKTRKRIIIEMYRNIAEKVYYPEAVKAVMADIEEIVSRYL